MNELLASHEKCLVLGSTGYSGIPSVGWNDKNLPNIVDYDVVVVDVRALDDKTLATISNEQFETLRFQFTRLLLSEGRIIVVSDFRRVHNRPKNSPYEASNYSWCPLKIGIAIESGNSLKPQENRYPNYLKHLDCWLYYFFLPNACLSQEFRKLFGQMYDDFDFATTVYYENRYKKLIAGSLDIIKFRHVESTKIPEYSGEIVLLPLIEKFDHKEAVRHVLNDLTGEPPGNSPPEWVERVFVPHVPEVEEKIQNREKKIDSLKIEIRKLTDKRNLLNSILRLLYTAGDELEEIVKFCFRELGAEVTPSKYGQEDFVLQYDGIEYLGEIKGASRSIKLTHLRQLYPYMLDYLEVKGQDCKGILFGNPWRTIPPNERNTPDKQNFPDNVVQKAKEWNIALVSSTKFFAVYCQFMKDKSKAPLIMKEIIDHNGIIEFESLT